MMRFSMRQRVVALGLLMALGLSSAHAAIFGDDEARAAILDLRQRFDVTRLDYEQRMAASEALVKQLSEQNDQLRRSLLDLQTQIDNLRADNARLLGAGEQSGRALFDLQNQNKAALQSLDDRLKALEPERVTVDGREFTADKTERRDFEAGLALFRKGDFANAQTAFADFIKRYPSSGYVPSAFFWLGNAQYATQNYTEAIANFRQLLAQTPDYLHASDAVLSIANCQIEMKDIKAARKTMEDLIKAYPKSDAAATAKQRLPKLKDGTAK